MNIFLTLIRPLGGKGLGGYPGVKRICSFLYKHLIPEGIGTIRYDGLKLDIYRRAYPEMLIWDGSKHLPIVARVFRNMVKPGMTVVDLGASIGYYTLVAASLVGPTGKVYAFEPELGNFKLLERNIERSGFKNITFVDKAVSNLTGTARLYLSNPNLLAHSLGRGRAGPNFIEVSTVTLDEFLGNIKVDVVKMNIEGAEPLALKGMKGIIEKSPNLVMLVEFDPRALKGLGFSQEEYIDTLLRYFDLQVISLKGLGTITPLQNIEQVKKRVFPRDGTAQLVCTRRGK